MLSINDLTNGVFITLEKDPYEILEVAHQHIGRGSSSIQAKIKNLRTGQVYSRNYKPSDFFEEAEIEKKPVIFIYAHKEEFWFHELGKPQARFSLGENILGEAAQYLKKNLQLTAVIYNDKLMSVSLPIKVDYLVKEAPPAVRGNTAQGGTKTIILENDLAIQAPLFIEEGEIVRVNTSTGEYAERINK